MDPDGDAAVIGELDGVGDEVDDDLAHPRRVAAQPRRQHVVDVHGELDAFASGLGEKDRGRVADGLAQREVARGEVDRAGLHFGVVEDVADH